MDLYLGVLKRTVDEFIRENEKYEGLELKYILTNNQDYKKTEAVLGDATMENGLILYIFDNEKVIEIPDWHFNYDEYIYEKLVNGYEIGTMSDDIHYSIWNDISQNYPHNIENTEGVKKYIEYCKEKGITKEYLDDKLGFNTPNILEQEKNYIQIKDGYVIMPKTMYEKEIELAYIRFVLGYDLLHETFIKYGTKECDVNYDFCDFIAREFIESEEYKNEKYSTYEMLDSWLSTNEERIEQDYLEYIGEEVINNPNMTILARGKRNKEPIVLVEHNTSYGKEYIVGLNYIIQNGNLSWGQGYYYDDNKTKAVEDFNKVIAGGNLADTFKPKKQDRER